MLHQRLIYSGFLALLESGILFAEPRVSLDIYNRDLALVRDVRVISLQKGESRAEFTGIAEGIFGHTAQVRPLEKADAVESLELTYHYDLLSHQKLITRYLGRWFSFTSDDATYQGRLLSIDDKHLFLKPDTTNPAIQVVERTKLTEMFYPGLPDGLFAEPTLVWKYNSDKALKDIPVEISYLTTDITWMCDYRAEISGEADLNISASFSIANDLPLSFREAKISLVVGQPHKSGDPANGSVTDEFADPSKPSKSAAPAAERIGELYRYELPRPVDLHAHQTIQIPFFKDRRIKAQRRLEFPHLLDDLPVVAKLRFDYAGDFAREAALPEGDIGLYRRTKPGELTFVGEDFIPSTPSGARVELTLGPTPAITARRVRLATSRPDRDSRGETWQVEVTNGREEPVTVYVEQRAFGYYRVSDVSVASSDGAGSSLSPLSEEASLLIFPLIVPASGKSTLTYTLTFGF